MGLEDSPEGRGRLLRPAGGGRGAGAGGLWLHAGKTTFTNLTNRFYAIAGGKIRYDGIHIHKIRKGALRRSLGRVLQDAPLFTGTVMDNILYGRLSATDE